MLNTQGLILKQKVLKFILTKTAHKNHFPLFTKFYFKQIIRQTWRGRKFATAILLHEKRGSKQKCDSGHAASAT